MSYDAYLAHATENLGFASELHAALEARGLRIWFNNFIVGPSIRGQMEDGLAQADYGIVILSPEFFAKKWTRHELDALLGLETPEEVRILPVWHKVTEAEVREHSPMLAMRSAAIFDSDVDAVAEALVKSIHSLSYTRSQASQRRYEIATGFGWSSGPVLMPASLRLYDDEFSDYGQTDLAYYPDTPSRRPGHVLPLMELVRSSPLWDGRRISVVGRQAHESVQVFDEIVPSDLMPADYQAPEGASIASYVFQLSSVEFASGELCYVHCIGTYNRAQPGWGPYAPDRESLCWVTGLLLASGIMEDARRMQVNAIYLAASTIMFTPPGDTRG